MPAYRLQTVLEIRERAEEAAKQAFAGAARALSTAQEELTRLEVDLEQRKVARQVRIKAHLDEVMARGVTGLKSLTLMNRFEQRLKDEEAEVALDIERQKDVVKAAEKVLAQRRQEMSEAATEKKAIEKHKDKWSAQIRKDRDDREQIVQEEIGSALFLARSRRSKSQ